MAKAREHVQKPARGTLTPRSVSVGVAGAACQSEVPSPSTVYSFAEGQPNCSLNFPGLDRKVNYETGKLSLVDILAAPTCVPLLLEISIGSS